MPLKSMSDVVALCPAAGCVHASYDERPVELERQVVPIAKHPPARLMPFENVEVPLPCTMRFPVVVAPPKMVRPLAWVPAPIVVDARERRPFENVSVVVVAFEGNGQSKVTLPFT